MKKAFRVWINDGSKTYQSVIDKSSFVIGRHAQADVSIPSDNISRKQLCVQLKEDSIWIQDLGSSNGSYLEGELIQPGSEIEYQAGSIITLTRHKYPQIRIEQFALEEKLPEAKVYAKVAGDPVEAPKKAIPKPKKPLAIVPPEKTQTTKTSLELASESEQKLFREISYLMRSEAESIKQVALEEAKVMQEVASQEAQLILQKAEASAKAKVSQWEAEAEQKIEQLALQEQEILAKLAEHETNLDQVKAHISELENQKGQILAQKAEAEEWLRSEALNLQERKNQLENEWNHFAETKKTFLEEKEEFDFEQRKSRARMETEIQEAKLKVAQINTEVEAAKAVKLLLDPEILQLKQEKENMRLEKLQASELLLKNREEISKAQLELGELTQKYAETKSQYQDLQLQLTNERSQWFATKETLASEMAKARKRLEEREAKTEELQSALEQLQINFDYEKARQLAIVDKESTELRASLDQSIITKQNEIAELSQVIQEKTSEAQVQIDFMLEAAQKEASDLKTKGKHEHDEALRKSQLILKQLDHELQQKKQAAKMECEKWEAKSKDLALEVQNKEQELEKFMAKSREEIRLEREAAVSECEARALEHKKSLDKERSEHVKQWQEMTQVKQVEADKLILEAKTQASEILRKNELQIAELKHLETQNIKSMKSRAEIEIVNRKQEVAKTLGRDVYAMVTSELYKFQNKVIDENFINTFSPGIKTLVEDVVLDKPTADSSKLQDILKTSVDSSTKEKLYWKKVAIISSAVVSVILILWIFPVIITGPYRALASAFEKPQDTQSDAFLKEIKEKRLNALYNPPTTPEFKDSYVDNVIYTTEFVAIKQNKEHQDKWILELNDFFIQNLDVKDTAIIQFIGLETSLINDLVKSRGQIPSENPDAEIALMRARETEFKQKLSSLFGEPSKVQRYYEFAKNFWPKHQKK